MASDTYPQYLVLSAPWERDDMQLIAWIRSHTALGVIILCCNAETPKWPGDVILPAYRMGFDEIITALSAYPLAGIMAINSESVFQLNQEVASRLGCRVLPEPQVWQSLSDKPHQHQTINQLRSVRPKQRQVMELSTIQIPESGYPYILKPVNLSGQVGVTCANTPDEFNAGLASIRSLPDGTAGRQTQCIIEPFVSGIEYEALAFVDSGTLSHWYMWERQKSPGTFFQSAQIIHTNFPNGMAAILTELLHTLQIQSGIFSVQALHTPDGWDLIEVMPRPLGGYALDMIQLCYGANPIGFLGALLSSLPRPEWHDQPIAPVMYMGFITSFTCPHFAGKTIESVILSPQIKQYCHHYYLNLYPGMTVQPQHQSSDRYGFILTTGQSLEEAAEKFQNAVSCITLNSRKALPLSAENKELLIQILDLDNQMRYLQVKLAEYQSKPEAFGALPMQQFQLLTHQVSRLKSRLNRVERLFKTRPDLHEKVYHVLFQFYHRIRLIKKLLAASYSSLTWQSPVHRTDPRRTGIRKFDKPFLLFDYERMQYHLHDKLASLEAYYAPIPGTFMLTHIRNAGMAMLFNLYYGLLAKALINPDAYILYGKHSYYETVLLLKKLPQPVKLVAFDETGSLKALQPHLQNSNCIGLLIDTVLNHPGGHIPNLTQLLQLTAGQSRNTPFYLLVDATLSGISFQPAQYFKAQAFPAYLHLIVYRSLIKYDQLGEDKVMAGTATYWAHQSLQKKKPGIALLKLLEINCLIGTQLPELSLMCLDLPTVSQLKYRMHHHEANGRKLAVRLLALKAQYPHVIRSITSAALNVRGKKRAQIDLTGGLVFMTLKPRPDLPDLKTRLTDAILKHGDRARVFIDQGQSFGFTYTRLCSYLLRIAPGIEDARNFERVIQCFEAGIHQFVRENYP